MSYKWDLFPVIRWVHSEWTRADARLPRSLAIIEIEPEKNVDLLDLTGFNRTSILVPFIQHM